jgi:ankyrin repeat protein
MLMNIDPVYVDDVRRILTWLCFSERPVRFCEVNEALAVEIGKRPGLNFGRRLQDPYDICRICPALIRVVETVDDLSESNDASQPPDPALSNLSLSIAHFSVQEYLESDRIRSQSAAKFALQSHTAHTELTKTCLIYLRNVRLHDLKEFPLAFYAAKHWYLHFEKGDEDCDSLLAAYFLGSEDDILMNWITIADCARGFWGSYQVDLERPSKSIASPLYYASQLGLYRLSQSLLLKCGANVNAQGGCYDNALQAASAMGHERIVELLIKSGANVNAQGGSYGNALQAASIRDSERIVELLITNGADVNAQGGSYGTALQAASAKGHERIVELLITNGAVDNAQGGFYGTTALQAASAMGHERIVELLITSGADVNAQGGSYGIALQAASSCGYERIVELLITGGADVNDQSGFYGNALQAASAMGHERIVELLITNGADINAQGGCYGNALQAASAKGHERIVELLITNGADINAQGGCYGNALQAASAKGHEQIVQLLLDRGAKFQ